MVAGTSWYIVVIEVIVAISRHNGGYGNQGEGLKSDEGQGISRGKEEKGERRTYNLKALMFPSIMSIRSIKPKGKTLMDLMMDGAGKFGGGETESGNALWGEGVHL